MDGSTILIGLAIGVVMIPLTSYIEKWKKDKEWLKLENRARINYSKCLKSTNRKLALQAGLISDRFSMQIGFMPEDAQQKLCIYSLQSTLKEVKEMSSDEKLSWDEICEIYQNINDRNLEFKSEEMLFQYE